ncbi:hypothetical protein A0O34_12155 [Chryseobacterium glaciei]|uniref:Trimeric autotransporter adhesin YadA-like head domain-containing protein n=1 Tax=Chryseobacterium glaciei TaxID=1685010 RepID=A0A172XWD0_9FLAO|nr:hypothetical protein [Chryseobacterium glaciei]ANF51216.1 hypothetical protein A0O34_12155 [Chryseobacterium glaciei]
MKNRLFVISMLSFTGFLATAQVGINTNQAQATLDVVGSPANSKFLDGIIAPRLTGNQLRAKNYTSLQSGAMVYVTAADSGPTGQTINVTVAGYYYFDGTKWVRTSEGTNVGTLTGFTSGNLSPLFTTTVSNPSTNPSLAFNLTNALANSIFGNNTGSTAAPAYFSASSLALAGDVTGTLGATTVVRINGSPLGTTATATTGQVLTFNGTNWVPATQTQSNDWKVLGNAGTIATSAALGATIASGNFLGTTDAQNLVFATGNNVKGILDTNGTLNGGNANTSSPYASFSWGSNNTFSNSSSSNIALGRGNTVAAQAANFPGVAIGASNSALNGAKVIGNTNFATDGNTVVLGNNNGTATTAVSGINVGNSNINSGGFAFGTGNSVTSNNYAFGNANTASGPAGAIGFGFGANAVIASQTVYANTTHTFSGSGLIGTAITDVGINMTPSATNIADLEVSKGVLLKGITPPVAADCNASNEGTIVYGKSGTTGNFYGCKQTGGAFAWQTL